MKTAFVTDSGTGESMEVLSREGIYSVPLQISCGEQSSPSMRSMSGCARVRC